MAFDLPIRLRAIAGVTALGVRAYFRSNRFLRRRARSGHPRQNLSEFPEEILLQIFRAVHNVPPPDSRAESEEEWNLYDRATRDIQNIRLTCRLFNKISSEFLIKFVGVNLSAESLTRLEGIMKHPTIRKGVSMVRIRLPVYERLLNSYIDKYAIKVMRYLHCYKNGMKPGVRTLANKYPLDPQQYLPREAQEFRAAIEPGHREYKRRYQEQYFLSKSRFIEGVFDALQMSGRPLRIEITDRNDFLWSYRQSAHRARKHNLLDVISRLPASTWEEADIRWPALYWSHSGMIPKLLGAFTADVPIEDLHFDITKTPSFHRVKIDRPRETPRCAIRNLRRLTYLNGTPPGAPGTGPQLMTAFYDFLAPESLRDLTLQRVELEPSDQWRSLTRISLIQVAFDFESLVLLLEPLKPHAVDIRLDECYLHHGGSWADVLDLFKDKQRRARLDSPRDLQLDDTVSQETIKYIFGHLEDWHGGASRAEQYIRGWSDANPVRQHIGIR